MGFIGKINIFSAFFLCLGVLGCNTVKPIMQIKGTKTKTLKLNRDASFFNHRKRVVQDDIFLCTYKYQGHSKNILKADKDITNTAGEASLSWGKQHI